MGGWKSPSSPSLNQHPLCPSQSGVKEGPLPGGMGRGVAFSARGVGAAHVTRVCPHPNVLVVVYLRTSLSSGRGNPDVRGWLVLRKLIAP